MRERDAARRALAPTDLVAWAGASDVAAGALDSASERALATVGSAAGDAGDGHSASGAPGEEHDGEHAGDGALDGGAVGAALDGAADGGAT